MEKSLDIIALWRLFVNKKIYMLFIAKGSAVNISFGFFYIIGNTMLASLTNVKNFSSLDCSSNIIREEGKFMDEQIIQKRILKVTIGTASIIILLILCSLVLIISINEADKDSYNAQLKSLVNEYKINFERQIDSDIQSLKTLASFVEHSQAVSFRNFTKGLHRASGEGQFQKIGYYSKSGKNVRVVLSKGIEEKVDLKDVNVEAQKVIKKSWEGEVEISEVYWDQQLKEKVIVYAVPIQDDTKQKVIGSLVGVKGLDIFSEILNGETITKVNLDVDWINAKGKFVTWSDHSIIKEKMETIHEGDYISKRNKSIIKQKMKERKSYFSEFQVGNTSYPICFQPLELNGWYLVGIDISKSVKSPVYFMLITIAGIFILVITLCAGAIFSGYKILHKNNEELIQLAYYDQLTGAFNFEKFRDEIQKALTYNTNYSLVVMNIRHFQYINELFGVKKADELLEMVIKTVKQYVIEGEKYCRYQGDQFYLLLRGNNREKIRQRLFYILNAISKNISESKAEYELNLYAGIATSQEGDKACSDNLIHKAEFALKQAKEGHGNTIKFYNERMHEIESLQNFIESNMNQALEQEEFKVYLQPKIALGSEKIAGAEALVRWIRGDGTMIFPDQFIPLFEKNGFCAELDLYMVEQTCKWLRKWMDEGKEVVPISINQSKILFYKSDYVERLCAITEKYHIPNRLITLEILEGLMARDVDKLNQTIQQLHKKGFRISLDDFGTGYSSLNILSKLDIDEVKLDRSFLSDDLMKNETQKVILKNVVNLAKDLHIETVIEGVETKEHHTFVEQIGCYYGQGYFYSKPIPCKEFEEKFMESKRESTKQ